MNSGRRRENEREKKTRKEFGRENVSEGERKI